jgi:hypothetical protein
LRQKGGFGEAEKCILRLGEAFVEAENAIFHQKGGFGEAEDAIF